MRFITDPRFVSSRIREPSGVVAFSLLGMVVVVGVAAVFWSGGCLCSSSWSGCSGLSLVRS